MGENLTFSSYISTNWADNERDTPLLNKTSFANNNSRQDRTIIPAVSGKSSSNETSSSREPSGPNEVYVFPDPMDLKLKLKLKKKSLSKLMYMLFALRVFRSESI